MWLWKAGILIVYLAVMVGVAFFVKAMLDLYDWWFFIPWMIGAFLIAWLMDRSGKFTTEPRPRRKARRCR